MDSSGTSCCGRPLEVIRLSESTDLAVDMLRCRTCARSSWRSGDRPLPRSEALAALAQVHRSRTPLRAQPRSVRVARARVAEAAAAPAQPKPVRVRRSGDPGLADLLPGWRVLGS